MSGSIVTIGTERPAAPPEASFALIIDFERGTPNPSRVFRAAEAMIQAFQELDRTLCESVDPKIVPIMMLEDIEAGSIKTWLGQQFERLEDEGLKTLDWKPLIGKYLVRAKYAVIRWSNKDVPGMDLMGLAREISTIASESDVKHLPDYAPPTPQRLAQSIRRIDEVKDILGPKDSMILEGASDAPIAFNLSIRWDALELERLAVRDTTRFEKMPMTLIIKRPDYLGHSKWDFRFGKSSISARIEDTDWLTRFQSRQVDVRPGDALRCLVTIEHKYGFDSELVSEEHIITEVESVAANQVRQEDLGL